ncbi:hypothetical protein KEM55_004364 [Ascosphaera atra]|nr:hypothetical protein KEM55_004364 [Ascosphaera atra]
MDPANPPEGQWFCSECEGKMQGHGLKAMAKTAASLGANQTEGPLGSLVSTAETLPQRSFQLPNGVRDYYTGVQTGKQGEYAPVAVLPRREVRTVARGTTNDERNSMHLYALQDNKGKFIFCVACGRSSLGNKPILVCDYCPCAWHLDCLPFPVANPPTQKLTSDKVYHHWKCPNHIEHDLKYIRRFGGRNGHIRRPRNPRFIDIDVIPSSSEEFNADFQAAAATAGAALGPGNGMGAGRVFDDVEQDGTVYRISERGLILDFIRRVKREKCVETSMREFYRACVAREDPEWIRRELLNAPKDVLREVVGDETDYLPDDPARKGLQARVKSTTQSNAVANVVPSTSESDAALGLLAMANTAALPGTAAPAAPAAPTTAAASDNAAVERLSGLVEKLLVATDRQDPNKGSITNDARVQPGPAPAESEAPSSNSDKPSSRKVILRFPRSVNIGQEQPRPSSAGSMSSAETTNTPGGTRRTRRSARHEREQQQQAERPETVPEPTVATAEGEESSERREDPETEAAGANRILPNAANELELLRSIQELVNERMKALGGDSSTALPTSTE